MEEEEAGASLTELFQPRCSTLHSLVYSTADCRCETQSWSVMMPHLPGTNQRNSPLGRRLAAALAWATVFGLAGKGKLSGTDFPRTEITNGQLHVKLYLPDAKGGYYRATRFDWSGVIASLEYKGHN